MKVEVSVSKMEDGQTTVGFLSDGIVAKNKERSVQEIKKVLGLLFNQLLKLLVQQYLQQTAVNTAVLVTAVAFTAHSKCSISQRH